MSHFARTGCSNGIKSFMFDKTRKERKVEQKLADFGRKKLCQVGTKDCKGPHFFQKE